MTGSDGLRPLGVDSLTLLLQFAQGTAATAHELARQITQRRGRPPGVEAVIMSKLNDGAAPADFTPTELHLVEALGRYEDSKSEVTDIQWAFRGRAREWARSNSDHVQDGLTQAINDHLGRQAGAVMGLTDEEIRSIRATVSSHASRIAQAFCARLAGSGTAAVGDTVDAVIDDLVRLATPVSALETLGLIVSAQSHRQLTLGVPEVAAAYLSETNTLRPLAEQILQARRLEATLPELKQEAEAAFRAVEAQAARARWDAAAPSP